MDSTVGSEIQKMRPWLVLSPAEMHDYLRTIIAAPMTTASKPASFRIPISFRRKRGLVLLDQIRALDKSRLVRRLGLAPGNVLARALTTLREVFQE